MKRTIIAGVVVLACGTAIAGKFLTAQDEKKSKPAPANETQQRASYGIGMNIGRGIKSDGLELDIDQLVQGLRDALSDAKPRFSQEELSESLQKFQTEMVQKQASRRQSLGDKNTKEGKAFLEANKQKKGVVALPSGLQYEVLKAGKGPSPTLKDTVKTHYHGTLVDGTVFDSSVEREEPAVFPVSGVIKGWTEALQKMKVGDKWRLVVPSELAYGPQGAGGVIGPHAVLVFEVELLGIE